MKEFILKQSKVEGNINAQLVVTFKQEFLGFGSIRHYIKFRDMYYVRNFACRT